MLMIERNVGERVRIGNEIVLTYIKRVGDRIWLGIQAPSEIPIVREEIAGMSPPFRYRGWRLGEAVEALALWHASNGSDGVYDQEMKKAVVARLRAMGDREIEDWMSNQPFVKVGKAFAWKWIEAARTKPTR